MGAPWAALPRAFAGEVRNEGQTLALEIIREIRQHIPEFSRPLAGQFGAGIQRGVETALAEFADLVEGSGRLSEDRLRVYRALGRGELAEGRSLDALQAAYRLGARIAWRRYARAAQRTGMSPAHMVALAEAVFAHIDGIASASVQGYAQAKADEAGTLHRRRQRLLALLVDGASHQAVTEAAQAAHWALPARLACVALGRVPLPPALAAAPAAARPVLPAPVLADLDTSEPFLLLPGPGPALRNAAVRGMLRRRGAVVGPTVPVGAAGDSLRWARVMRAALPDPYAAAPIHCERHLPELLLLGDPALVRLIAHRRLRSLAELLPKQRQRLEETLLVWLQTSGSAPEVAAHLGIHAQTARQRLRRIQQLFGPALHEPDARFELEVALRGRRIAAAFAGPPNSHRTAE